MANQLGLNADQLLSASSASDLKYSNVNEGGLVAYRDRRTLPRSAVWLINSVCWSPRSKIAASKSATNCLSQLGLHNPKPEFVGRLIAGVIHWFQCVFVQQNDSIGTSVEALKTEISDGWLTDMMELYFDIFTTCLMPDPPEYARIGRHWCLSLLRGRVCSTHYLCISGIHLRAELTRCARACTQFTVSCLTTSSL